MATTSMDAKIFWNYMNMKTARSFKVNVGDEGTPDWKTVVVDDTYMTAESFLKDYGFILDSFSPPVVPSVGQIYPTLVSGMLNPGTFNPVEYTDYLTSDLTWSDCASLNDFENWATVPETIEDEKLVVASNMLSQRGYGFRKYYPSRLVDADLDEPFGLDTDGVAVNSYLQTMFSSSQYVTTVSVWMSAEGYDGEFQIKGSNNGADWTDLGTVFAPTLSGLNSKTFTNFVGYSRYRLVLTKAPILHPEVKVCEIAFYAKPQFMFEDEDDCIPYKEASSIAFFSSRDASEEEVPITATATLPVAFTAVGHDLLYFWVKGNRGGYACDIEVTFNNGGEPISVSSSVYLPEADTWCRVWMNIGAFLGAGEVDSVTVTPHFSKGLLVKVGAMRTGETYMVATGGYPHGEGYLPFSSSNAKAYLFFTSSESAASILGMTRFEVKAISTVEVDKTGYFDELIPLGVLVDSSEPTGITNLYCVKFSFDGSTFGPVVGEIGSGQYYWNFEIPLADALEVPVVTKVVGFAIADGDIF